MSLNHVKSYRAGHPNPQFLRENYEILNGYWNFCFDEADIGESKHYEKYFPEDAYKILVPYVYQAKINELNIPYRQCDVIWYQKEIQIDDLSKHYLLKFFGVDFKTMVFVNGVLVGTHYGAYTQFDLDITSALKLGKNNITLRVVDRMLSNQFRGKQRWKKDNFTCFYKEFSGIFKDVILEKVDETYIDSFTIKASYKKKKIDLHIQTNNEKYDKILFEIIEDGKVKRYEFNDKKSDYNIDFITPKKRDYNTPTLYDACIKLIKNNDVIDEIKTYFGFVDYEINNKHIFVNNVDTYLKFVLDQNYYVNGGITPTEEEIYKDLKLIKDFGFNGLRKHEFVPIPLCFYYCDLLGLYVWQEVPSAYGYSYDMNKAYRKLIPQQIIQNISHPSIMSYVLFNESWGVEEINASVEEQKFVEEMYHKVKEMNTGKFVIGNDGWEHVKTDLLTLHNYTDSSEGLHNQYDQNLIDVMKGENPYSIDNFKRFFAGDYRYGGEPIIFSEFAGIALKKDVDKDTQNWGYGESADNEEAFITKYQDLLSFIKSKDCVRGFCMTQLTDVEQETNGLVTYDRVPKVEIARIRKIHEEFK